jgi:hypothetical protein
LMRLAPVRAAIDERLNRLRTDLATRAIGRRLAELRGTFEQIAAEEAERALTEEFNSLDAAQRELLQKFASTVARRLAHLPLAGMRAAAAHASTDAVDAFFREARLTRSTNGDFDATGRWKANGDATGRWKTDLEALDATGSESQVHADVAAAAGAAIAAGGGWKPDADSNEWTGRQRRLRDDAADDIGPQAMLAGDDLVRRPVIIGDRRATDIVAGRQGTRGAQASDADAVTTHAKPVRAGWAKD